jgi:hypothetical protein
LTNGLNGAHFEILYKFSIGWLAKVNLLKDVLVVALNKQSAHKIWAKMLEKKIIMRYINTDSLIKDCI